MCFGSPQGYFNQTVMYYGGYINGTKDSDFKYNMQLAYFFTIAAYLLLCGVSLIYRLVDWRRTKNSHLFSKKFHFSITPPPSAIIITIII